MAIIVNLDMMLVRRKVSQVELSERIGITQANLSILKTNKAKAIRFTTLDALCRELNCQPGDLLEHVPDGAPGNSIE
ncbi:MAG: helix-turn-helix transcriptional regulator [Acidobacteriia bacterium]|nr:helix-turn-helix transcriptional regulator [Terriglobia bacterium]